MKKTTWPGNWKACCDVCGFWYPSGEMRLRWDNLMVCEKDYEQRHPQDFIRGFPDEPAPPWTRPQEPNVFTNVVYVCTPEGSSAVAGIAVAGCSVVGTQNTGQWPLPRSAVAGIAITGGAVAGYS